MDIEEKWEKAIKTTRILRGRVKTLYTFSSTDVPYIFLASSAIHEGSTVVRKGKIKIDKPIIFLPDNMPRFQGFDFDKNIGLGSGIINTFLLMRGIRLPSLKYNNNTYSLEVEDMPVGKSAQRYLDMLQRKEDVATALIRGEEDCWQLSLLLYMVLLVDRSAPQDIRNLLNKMMGKG